ncbi:MAG TPA: hypothetical protein VF990_14995 [Candidatus Dormibacteraeota bacterium]
MLLLAIPALALGLGFIGLRSSAKSYVLIGAIALVLCYIAYTR